MKRERWTTRVRHFCEDWVVIGCAAAAYGGVLITNQALRVVERITRWPR